MNSNTHTCKPRCAMAMLIVAAALAVTPWSTPATLQASLRAAEPATAGGQTQEPNRPIIAVDRQTYDLGMLATNSTAKAEFVLSNKGSAELEITNIGKCCGASTELTSTKIAPGESATLKVEYFTGVDVGQFKKDLLVYSNDPVTRVLTLTVSGTVKQYLIWDPLRLALFLNKPNLGCPLIRLTALDGEAFAITGVLCVGDCITVEYDPNVKATEFVLRPVVDKQKLLALEYPKGTLQFRLTRKDYPILGLPFDLIPNYSVNPGQLYLMNAEPGKPMTREVDILDNYVDPNQTEADFTIESVTSEGGLCRLARSIKSKDGYKLEIEVLPPAPQQGQRSFHDELAIKVKGSQEQLLVYVRGFYASKVFMNPAGPIR